VKLPAPAAGPITNMIATWAALSKDLARVEDAVSAPLCTAVFTGNHPRP
jgi:hypothetical protein